MNKQLKLSALLFAAVLGFAPTVSAVPVNLPSGPRGLANNFTRLVGTTGAFAGLGGLVGYNTTMDTWGRSAHVNHLTAGVFAAIGGLVGFMIGVEGWLKHSPQGCVNKFNEVYNQFLSANVLRNDVSDVVWMSGYSSDRWPLVDLKNVLADHQANLSKVIAFGRVLTASSAIHALGADVALSIGHKIDVMVAMQSLVRDRIALVESQYLYPLQSQMKALFDRMKKDLAAEREYLRMRDELIRNQLQSAVAQSQGTSYPHPYIPVYQPYIPDYQPAITFNKHCSLCSGIIPENKGYKTECACPVGRFSYHHECIKTHLRDAHNCPKCRQANPVLHSDFNDGFVPSAPTPQIAYLPTMPAPSAPPAADAAYTCALCSGNIQATKRYRTDCDCAAGKYYYHHECVAGTLKTNGAHCPKCNKSGTTVRSAF